MPACVLSGRHAPGGNGPERLHGQWGRGLGAQEAGALCEAVCSGHGRWRGWCRQSREAGGLVPWGAEQPALQRPVRPPEPAGGTEARVNLSGEAAVRAPLREERGRGACAHTRAGGRPLPCGRPSPGAGSRRRGGRDGVLAGSLRSPEERRLCVSARRQPRTPPSPDTPVSLPALAPAPRLPLRSCSLPPPPPWLRWHTRSACSVAASPGACGRTQERGLWGLGAGPPWALKRAAAPCPGPDVAARLWERTRPG